MYIMILICNLTKMPQPYMLSLQFRCHLIRYRLSSFLSSHLKGIILINMHGHVNRVFVKGFDA